MLGIAAATAVACAGGGQTGQLISLPSNESIGILGPQPGGHLSAMAAGDVNGDGEQDLVLGAIGTSASQEQPVAGAAYLIEGPLTKVPTRDLAEVHADSTIRGTGADDQFGRAVAIGDLNGDGLGDVIVAAPGADGLGGTRKNSGEVYVFLGSRSFPYDVDLATEHPFLTFVGANPGDNAGWSLLTGDVNGDGIDDLIIATPLAPGATSDALLAGRVYIFYGSRGLQPSTIDMGSGFPGSTIVGAAAGGRLGWSMALGDIDGDGSRELIVSAPFVDPGGRREAGRFYAVTSPQPGETKRVNELPAKLTVSGQRSGDQVGYSLAVGDISGDGVDDVLAGAVSANGPAGDRKLSGAAFVFFGERGGSRRDVDLGSSPADVALWGAHPNDRLGRAVALGDVDSDGKADLIMAAPTASSPDGKEAEAGVLLVVRGSSALPGEVDFAMTNPDLTVAGPQSASILGHGNFGRPSLTAAHLESSASTDIIVAAPGASPKSREGAGAVYAILGSRLRLTTP